MTDYSTARRKFVDWVKQSLIGEHLKDDILMANNPFDRYTTGILYPIGSAIEIDEEENTAHDDADSAEQPPKKMRYQPPSSMGFSFYVDRSLKTLRVFYSARGFKKLDKKDHVQKWKKSTLVQNDGEEVEATLDYTTRHEVMGGRGRIDVVVRPHGDGKIITVTLCNIICPCVGEKDKERDIMAEGALFESELRCFIPEQAVRNYPRVSHTLLSDEEQELELRYKDERVYAIGHGVAVDWLVDAENGNIEVFSDFMPVVEVPQVTANTGHTDEVLTFNYLQSIENDESVFSRLEAFVDAYEDWVEQQEFLALSENPEDRKVAQRLTGRMQEAKDRMKLSISRLQGDSRAQYAFATANRAMLMQMELSDPAPKTPYAWRPFQLAFFLMALESSIDEESDFRDCVDLIWFPTGGGKTEAYLGVMALVFIYRRLSYAGSGGGTTAIMRYTLRLLTSQQFVRACKVVSALELIRRGTDILGDEPFSVGLWLGGASSPNTYVQALDAFKRQNFSKFVLRQCPWCASTFSVGNYQCTENRFHFLCLNESCALGRGSKILPFNVVDEALYDSPPTLLIATVDKFARLPWEERSCAFFGGNRHRPPELVIQDELHLISGALGSIVGLYEVGFESILVSRGVYPKFIASTATVRQAQEQVQLLFGREKMAVFPPVGLRQKDSYFAKEVPVSEKPGRFYIGYMAFGRKRADCLMDLAGSLIAAPQACFSDDTALKDAWWTQMVYHGSLKGVGNSRTNFQSGIPRVQRQLLLKDFFSQLDRLEPGRFEQLMQNEHVKNKDFYTGDCLSLFSENSDSQKLYQQFFPARDLTIKSLTSNQTAEENASVFEGLKAQHSEVNALDVVLATNMVSVGLDEPRLALMVINGQPLTTAEYIQASSRVGRGKTPGMVFINYYKTQARSLSHYENFRAYHRSFYRFVEPSSLTPFTRQVRNRALHAVLVSAVRHGEKGLIRNADAELFNKDNIMISKIMNQIKRRIKSSLLGTVHEKQKIIDDCEAHLMKLTEEWAIEIETSTNLRYSASDKSASSLIFAIEENQGRTGLWPTLNSMRNVEKTGLFEIDGES